MTSSSQSLTIGVQVQVYLYYIFLFLGGYVCIPLSLVTMYVTKANVRRYPTFINCLISWFVYTLPTMFLLFTGQQLNRHPSFNVCLAQAALCYGTSAEATVATFTLILQLWLEFRGNVLGPKSRSYTSIALVGIPWLTFFPFVIGILVAGLRDPTVINNDNLFYCGTSLRPVYYSLDAIILLCLLFMFILMLLVLRVIYRNGRPAASTTDDRFSVQIPARIVLFNAYCIMSVIIFCINVIKPSLVFPYVFMSTIPFAAFIILGLQKEYLRLWLGWFRLPRRKSKSLLETMIFNRNPATTTTLGGGTLSISGFTSTLAQKDQETQETASTMVDRLHDVLEQEALESQPSFKESWRQSVQDSETTEQSTTEIQLVV